MRRATTMCLILSAAALLGGCGGGGEQARAPGFDPGALAGARPKLDAPQVPSGMEVVDAMLALARVRPDDFVVDLGAGDGRILVAAARSFGARGLGVDIDPASVARARANARDAGVAGLVTFRREDLFTTPLAEADVVTLYLTQAANLRLRPRILARMRPGARLVSHDFDMGDWRWDDRRRVGDATIYLWIVPARVEGDWALTVDGLTVPLVIEQHYQSFTGTVREARIELGRLNGDRISFRTNMGEGRRSFEGRVLGNRIEPLDPRAGWRATRIR